MKHAEDAAAMTFCGRHIRPAQLCEKGDIPQHECVTEPTEDTCKRCASGLRGRAQASIRIAAAEIETTAKEPPTAMIIDLFEALKNAMKGPAK